MYQNFDRYYKEQALSIADTYTKDLPESGLLQGILLKLTMINENGLCDLYKNRIVDHVTKIEVTNGGTEKMFSLTGQETKALDFYLNRRVMPEHFEGYSHKYQRTWLYVPFGRFYDDPEFMLNLSEWDQVQLEMTNDLTTDYCVDKEFYADVQLIFANDVADPAQYMKYYEWKKEKPSADAQYVYHKIPTTDLIAFLMCQLDPDLTASTGAAVSDPVTNDFNIKMTYKEGKEVIWDHRPRDVMRSNSVKYGPPNVQMVHGGGDQTHLDVLLAYVNCATLGMANQQTGAATDILEWKDMQDRRFAQYYNTGCEGIHIMAEGDGYYGTMVLLDTLRNMEDIIDPSKGGGEAKGEIKLEWYGYTDDHTFRTCIGSPVVQGAT